MDQNADIEVILSEPQTAILESRAAVILDMAGQGAGKSQNIGYSSGMFVSDFPRALGFIGANTYLQLSQSTLVRTFALWKEVYGYTEYEKKANPAGAYVVDKRPPPHFERIHHLRDYSGTISFYNGALIFLGSLDNYMAHDGKEFAWAHLDETKDTKEEALKEVIIGRLRQYGIWYDATGALFYDTNKDDEEARTAKGWKAWNPLYIHTSPALGGVDWLNKMFKLDKFEAVIKTEVLKKEKGYFNKVFDNKHVVIYSTYHNSFNLPPNYIPNQEATLTDENQILKLVYGYPFSKSGGEWFPSFRRDLHVRKVPRIVGIPVHSTWDFNAVPYMTDICSNIRYITRYLDEVGFKHDAPQPGFKAIEVMRISIYREYCLEGDQCSTEGVCEAFAADHEVATTEVFYYGDSNGLSRIPGLGSLTNFKIIEDKLFSYLHNDSKRVKAPNVAPFQRRDLLNNIFRGKYPEIEIEIDAEACPNLINDCEHVKVGPKGKVKTTVIDPRTKKSYETIGHTSDALEYMVCELCKHYLK